MKDADVADACKDKSTNRSSPKSCTSSNQVLIIAGGPSAKRGPQDDSGWGGSLPSCALRYCRPSAAFLHRVDRVHLRIKTLNQSAGPSHFYRIDFRRFA